MAPWEREDMSLANQNLPRHFYLAQIETFIDHSPSEFSFMQDY